MKAFAWLDFNIWFIYNLGYPRSFCRTSSICLSCSCSPNSSNGPLIPAFDGKFGTFEAELVCWGLDGSIQALEVYHSRLTKFWCCHPLLLLQVLLGLFQFYFECFHCFWWSSVSGPPHSSWAVPLICLILSRHSSIA